MSSTQKYYYQKEKKAISNSRSDEQTYFTKLNINISNNCNIKLLNWIWRKENIIFSTQYFFVAIVFPQN